MAVPPGPRDEVIGPRFDDARDEPSPSVPRPLPDNGRRAGLIAAVLIAALIVAVLIALL
jgi:hypothetical protein